MTADERLALIDRYLEGADAFDKVLSMDPALLEFRPALAGAWTIHEHVVHFVESDIGSFHRYRKAVAEPGGPAVGYDEELWTRALDYRAVPLEEALSLLKSLRAIAARHLRSIASRDWSAMAYTHSSQGPVGLEAWLKLYVDHAAFHLEYIERNKKLFTGR
jgi:hypothetical protein